MATFSMSHFIKKIEEKKKAKAIEAKTIDPKKALRLGFEIECKGNTPLFLRRNWPKNLKVSEASPEPGDEFWGITDDGSLDGESAEIQSPINPSEKDIFQVIQFLKGLGSYIDRQCGFHIHVSHPDHPIGIKLNRVIRYWAPRGEYIDCGTSNLYDKYNPVRRLSPDHLEVRAFNGTLGFRTILGRLKLVRDSIIFDKEIIWNVKPICVNRRVHELVDNE